MKSWLLYCFLLEYHLLHVSYEKITNILLLYWNKPLKVWSKWGKKGIFEKCKKILKTGNTKLNHEIEIKIKFLSEKKKIKEEISCIYMFFWRFFYMIILKAGDNTHWWLSWTNMTIVRSLFSFAFSSPLFLAFARHDTANNTVWFMPCVVLS